MHGKHRVEYVLGIVGDRCNHAEIARIAEQHVDLAEPRDSGGNRVLDLIGFGHVGGAPGDLTTDVAGGFLQRGLMQVDQHDLGALVAAKASPTPRQCCRRRR